MMNREQLKHNLKSPISVLIVYPCIYKTTMSYFFVFITVDVNIIDCWIPIEYTNIILYNTILSDTILLHDNEFLK